MVELLPFAMAGIPVLLVLIPLPDFLSVIANPLTAFVLAVLLYVWGAMIAEKMVKRLNQNREHLE